MNNNRLFGVVCVATIAACGTADRDWAGPAGDVEVSGSGGTSSEVPGIGGSAGKVGIAGETGHAGATTKNTGGDVGSAGAGASSGDSGASGAGGEADGGASGTAGAGGGSAGNGGSSGTLTETICYDDIDNDADGLINCADDDCAGKVCRSKRTTQLYPTKDIQRASGTSGGESDGSTTISIFLAPAAAGGARLEFTNIPTDTALTVTKAKLFVYCTAGKAVIEAWDVPNANVTTRKQATSVPPDTAGYQSLDITALVKAWIAQTQPNRAVDLKWGSSAQGSVSIRATEYAGTASDPYLEIEYQAVCKTDTCPEL